MDTISKPALPLTRRGFLAGTGALVLSSALPPGYGEGASAALGTWFDDEAGLPDYEYTGPMRFAEGPRENGTILLPDDPYFLMGNYRLTLLAHASGLYEILSGESIWARLNCGDALWSGENHADSLNSSRLPTAGLSIAMPYCAHAHAWPLYRYLRLRANIR